jgi:hypothetical protein
MTLTSSEEKNCFQSTKLNRKESAAAKDSPDRISIKAL